MSNSELLDIRKIRFGFTSAEKEREQAPELLLNGYIDLKHAAEEARSGSKFLFLGYKGAGKSAIGERLQLSSDNSHDEFVKLIPLKDFPFTPFSKMVRGDAEPETKFPTAWSWVLLIYLLDSFSKDEGVSHYNVDAFHRAVTAFAEMGLSPVGDPGKIVKTSAKHSFKIKSPGSFAEWSFANNELRPASEIPDFVDNLKELVRHIRSNAKHYLVIDGLDDVLTSRDLQFKSLGALVFEVERLNSLFKTNGVPAKIVLLCRTDIFERLSGANKNKVRQDSAVELDWYHDPRDPNSSLLVQAAQLRTAISFKQPVDLFRSFFPAEIDRMDSGRYLLEMTRHTPRDFFQLFTHIQAFATAGLLSEGEIKSGLRDYSIKYFLPEIKDELSGYATSDEIDRLFKVLGRMRKRDVTFSELSTASEALPKPIEEARLYELLEVMFECSAIGNIQHKPGGTTYYTFKYRNRHSTFNETEGIMFHRGLWKALNVV